MGNSTSRPLKFFPPKFTLQLPRELDTPVHPFPSMPHIPTHSFDGILVTYATSEISRMYHITFQIFELVSVATTKGTRKNLVRENV